MRSLLPCALCAVFACGPAAPQAPQAPRAPGWYEVPPDPATRWFAELRLTQVGPATVTGELPDGIELAVQWPGEAPQRFTGTFPEPPAAARTGGAPCEEAEGLLLAYEGEQLVGVSFKPVDRFPGIQTFYNQKLAWRACATGSRELFPMMLFRDPRLSLALCADACAQPVLDRTRVRAAGLELDGEGRVSFSPSLVHAPAGLPLVITVNGEPFEATAAHLRDPGPWVRGENRVKVQLGELPPWEAVVVLPEGRLAPKASGFREGADFELDWSAQPWASAYEASVWPREPLLKVGALRFSAKAPPLTARYEGFPATTTAVMRVGVRVSAEVETVEGYALTVVDDTEAPVAP